MKISLVLFVLLFGSVASDANAWRPHDRLLDAVSQIESNNGTFLYGDRGMSLGHFQMQKKAWLDVVEWRKKKNLPTHDYRKNVFDPKISRSYAANYLTILHDRLKERYKREPSVAEIYAAYNMGLTSFRKCNYSLARVNSVTTERCKLVAALVK